MPRPESVGLLRRQTSKPASHEAYEALRNRRHRRVPAIHFSLQGLRLRASRADGRGFLLAVCKASDCAIWAWLPACWSPSAASRHALLRRECFPVRNPAWTQGRRKRGQRPAHFGLAGERERCQGAARAGLDRPAQVFRRTDVAVRKPHGGRLGLPRARRCGSLLAPILPGDSRCPVASFFPLALQSQPPH